MLEMLLATMVETDLKVMAMATMWEVPGSESLVSREHVGVALAGVVH